MGSGLKVDRVRNRVTPNPGGNPAEITREFFPAARAHGFPDIVDNYAGFATRTNLRPGARLYQLLGSNNGVAGRFEWIVENGQITHRMFVEGGKLNGIPITP